MPKKAEQSLLSPKFAMALQFANEIHNKQTRGRLEVPYISHLMAVSGLVMEYGGNETQAIAALLHDAAEDCGGRPMLEAVRVMFGEDVSAIVAACTDTFEDPKPKWQPRKEAYLKTVATKPGRTKLVCCADKLHNLSNTLRDISNEGYEPWKERMAKTQNGQAEKQIWYYTACFEALSQGWSSPMLNVFASALGEFQSMAGVSQQTWGRHNG